MTRKIIITNDHFKNSGGYHHNLDLKDSIETRCPLWGALFQEDGISYYVGGTHVSPLEENGHSYYIPYREVWNPNTVVPLVEKAKAGEVVPDFELELEYFEHQKLHYNENLLSRQ